MTTFSFIQITDHHLRESESLLTHGYSTVRAFQAVLRHIADNVDRFWEAVCGSSVIGIFCGHTHATYEAEVAGIPVFGLRSTAFQFTLQDKLFFCFSPPHYRLVTIHDGRLTTEIFEVPL